MPFIPDKIACLNSGHQKVIPVLASFDMSGNIRPLYVRINGDSYKILSSIASNYGPIIKFICTVPNRGMQREIILVYHPREMVWTMS